MRDFTALVRGHLSPLALPRRREIKIVEELAAQLEDAYDALVAGGATDEDAWNELQRRMPDWKTLEEELLEAEPVLVRLAQPRGGTRAAGAVRASVLAVRSFLGFGLARDVRSAVRLLLKDRGFSAATILTLAVCLGVNVAIFTVVYSVLLRPLPVPDPHRIVALGDVYPTLTPDDILSNTAPSYFDRLEALTALQEQALFAYWFDTLAVGRISEELRGMRATPSLFRVLQVQPALGRGFTDAEGEIGADRKIILSHGLWQRLYGGDPTIVGRDVRLGWTGQPYTIVGVMPRGFSFFEPGYADHARAHDEIQFWIPLSFTAAQRTDAARTRYGFFHLGRLRAGATIEQVQAQVDALNARNFERFPEFGLAELGMYTAVTRLQDALTRSVRRILYLLWGGATFVLLIGALNIANLSLARTSGRARELVTRLALGAGRLRLTRELVLEGVVLATAGGLAGMAIADWIVRTLLSGGLANLPNSSAVRLDAIVLGVTMAAAALVGVLIGLVPAAALGRANLGQVLAEGSRLATGGRSARLFRRGLIVTQVAASVVLLAGAALLMTSFRNLLSVDAGFDPEGVVTATIFPPPSRYEDQRAVIALSDRVLDAFRRVPGVTAAGLTSNIALSGRTSPATVAAADRPPEPGEALVLPSVVMISPGYFEAMRTPLVRGRYFAESDRERSQPVAIVDERLAARLWPAADPLGKRLYRGDSPQHTVVGVVRDVRFDGLAGRTESIGAAYFPHTQAPGPGRLRWIVVKTAAEPAAIVPALRSALASIDPDLPLSDIQTMGERTSRSVLSQKLAVALASTFGIVALLLSVVGIYGVLAYVVARRTREIGIRIALGSSARGIFRLVFNEGLALVAAGLTLGLFGAFLLAGALAGHVFGITPTDPLVLGAVVTGTGIVALLACVSPARRATRVDPLIVLNEQ